MRVSLRLLRYFTAAAETGSTTAAAKLLNVSQPSISVAIRELEALFDDTLFTRESGAKMTLTRFGVRKLAEAHQLLNAAASFEADDSGDAAAGEVQIGVFSDPFELGDPAGVVGVVMSDEDVGEPPAHCLECGFDRRSLVDWFDHTLVFSLFAKSAKLWPSRPSNWPRSLA